MIKYSNTDRSQEIRARAGSKMSKAHQGKNDTDDIISKIKNWQKDSEGWTGKWSSAQDKWHRMRMRIKKTKTFPFVGCCLSSDTEVLTAKGWKNIKKVSTSDKVYSMNLDTRAASYEKVAKLWEFNADKLLSVKSNSIDLLMTDNHKQIVFSQGNKKLRFIEAKELNTAHKVPLTSIWKGKTPDNLYGFNPIDFCKFLGWYISEGFTYVTKTIGICQSVVNQNGRDMIKELLDKMGLKYSENKSSFLVSCKGFSLEARKMFVSLGKSYQKFIPSSIKNLDTDCLKALLETMILGDGTVSFNGKYSPSSCYYTSSKKLSDDVQEICQKIGLRARIDIRNRIGKIVGKGYKINRGIVRHLSYEVHILLRKTSKISRTVIKKVDYSGKVYCPTTEPYHTIYVRRNGIAVWTGNSNLRMPTIETKIRKLKAALMNVIYGIRPIVQVVPSPSGDWESARKIEKFLDHLIMDKIKVKDKSLIAIDQTLEKGFYLLKPYWRIEITTRVEELSLKDLSMQEAMWLFDAQRRPEEVQQAITQRVQADMSDLVIEKNLKEIERITNEILSGKEEIKFTLQDVLYNCPDVSLCSPERVYVPTTTGVSPQSAQYIIHEFFLPLNTLKQNAKHKNWDMGAVDDIEATKEMDMKKIDTTKDQREGIERLQQNNELVKIWECYCWYDINNDGAAEKCVITMAPDFDKELRKITLPFYSGKFPFVKLFYELTDDRWFSHRGIPELIEDIVKEIDIQHMQKIDRQTLTNAPMYIYRAGLVNPKTVQFVFGQGIPAQGMQNLDDIMKPLNSHNPNVEFSYEREQMILETKVEELIGQVDYSLQSMINKREPRTLGEVELQNQSMQRVFGLDADMFRESFAELFNWIFDLWSQYGEDSYEFLYLGQSQQGEVVKLSREEIQNKYKITIRGNDQNTSPQVRMQKAQQIMLGAQNQIALQMGVITPIHVAQAYKRFYQELDIPNWEELVATPEQIMQQMQNQSPPPDDIKIKAEDLTDGEIAQALQKRGIQPDVKGRLLNEQNRRSAEGVEQLTKIAGQIGKEESGRKLPRKPRK